MESTKISIRRNAVDDVIELSSSSQYKELIKIIKDSGAYTNKFFEKCNFYGLSKDELKNYVINWYPITESFAKYGLLYTHNVINYIGKHFDYESLVYRKYEKFFCEVLEISAGEFKISKTVPNEFHPRTFTRLAPKLDIKIKDLVNRNLDINHETKNLEMCIVNNFKEEQDILSGFANYFVVETIAYNIVESMDNSFGKLESKQGGDFYNNNEMLYIKEHLRLEVLHCGEVKQMLKTLDLGKDDFEKLKHRVELLANIFGRFWAALLF